MTETSGLTPDFQREHLERQTKAAEDAAESLNNIRQAVLFLLALGIVGVIIGAAAIWG